MEAASLRPEDQVDMRQEGGRIVIERLRQRTYSLEDLLKGITAKNRHDAVELGRRKAMGSG